MEEKNPLVSIIVRTKDRPKLLKKALQSIASQTYRPIEVVLVNDGGCDLPEEELKEILGDVSLNYIRLKENRGRAGAGNIGIENAKGGYIGFLDDDDELYPEHAAILTGFLQESDYRVAFTDAQIVRVNYDHSKKEFVEIIEGFFLSEDFLYDALLFENYIPFNTLLIRRDVIEVVGKFDDTFEIFEDWDLLIRIAAKYPFKHIPVVTSKYVQWSRDFQIANVGWHDARTNYLAVLTKHDNQRTPEVAYKYYLRKLELLEKKELSIKNLEEQKLLDEQELQTTKQELQTTKQEFQITKDKLQMKTAYIEELQSGIGWMSLDYYRRHIKSRLAPVGTRRWKAYNKILKGLKILERDGLRTSVGKVRHFFREVKASSSIKKEHFIIPKVKDGPMETVDTKISVVIPTKDAGSDFYYLLERLRKQKGIKAIDIIVVDSGSEDDTLSLAEHYGAKIFSINPSEFGHGRTRNYGAQHATGEYLIFLSQDAIPIGDTCFSDIVKGMKKDPKIAAVSAKQIPRSDADLFACWEIWNHHEKFLRHSEDNVVSIDRKAFESLGPADKRRVTQIDNIFSCVSRDIFDKFTFNDVPYAEDLDLGLRLIKDGYKIGFLSSVGVIHSHNRNSAYYFKRSIIDRKSLVHFLGYEPINWVSIGINSFAEMVQYVQLSSHKLDYAVPSLIKRGVGQKSLSDIFDSLHHLMLSCPKKNKVSGNDRVLTSIFNKLAATSGATDIDVSVSTDVLIQQFFSTLENLKEFLSCYKAFNGKTEEIIIALYKLNAVVLGANIGDYLAFQEIKKGVRQTVELDDIIGVRV